MAGWYQIGKTDLIFAYGKSGSTFLDNLHQSGRLSRPLNWNSPPPEDSLISPLAHNYEKMPHMTVNIILREPLSRYCSGLHMIINELFSKTLLVPKYQLHFNNLDFFHKAYLNQVWWQDMIEGFMEHHGIDSYYEKQQITSIYEIWQEKYENKTDMMRLANNLKLFQNIFIDPIHIYHLGNYMLELDEILTSTEIKLNIIDLSSLDFFFKTIGMDTSGVSKYESARNNIEDIKDYELSKKVYGVFKDAFKSQKYFNKIKEYVSSDVEIYNKAINFKYNNIQKVYIDNKEITCPT